MFRSHTIVPCAVGVLLAATLSFGLAQEDPDPEIAALQTKVQELEAKLAVHTEFLEAQAAAGEELMNALARSEAEGFTAGINPKSREILLAGLRAQAEAMQSAGAGDDEDAEQPDERRSERGRRRGQ